MAGRTERVFEGGGGSELAGSVVHSVAGGYGKDVVFFEETQRTFWPCLEAGVGVAASVLDVSSILRHFIIEKSP